MYVTQQGKFYYYRAEALGWNNLLFIGAAISQILDEVRYNPLLLLADSGMISEMNIESGQLLFRLILYFLVKNKVTEDGNYQTIFFVSPLLFKVKALFICAAFSDRLHYKFIIF